MMGISPFNTFRNPFMAGWIIGGHPWAFSWAVGLKRLKMGLFDVTLYHDNYLFPPRVRWVNDSAVAMLQLWWVRLTYCRYARIRRQYGALTNDAFLRQWRDEIFRGYGLSGSDIRRVVVDAPLGIDRSTWEIVDCRREYLKQLHSECKRIASASRWRRTWWKIVDWMLGR
jgi:hypothetical protein